MITSMMVVVRWNQDQGNEYCEVESLSTHRSCTHKLFVDGVGGPARALRALADQIEDTDSHFAGIPD